VTGYAYLQVPVDADEGFPQTFRMAVGGGAYVVGLSVTVTDETLLAPGTPLALPLPGAFLVATVTRDGPGTPAVVFRRKVVRRLEYGAAELALVFTDISIDPRNLNASGAFGSRVTAGVATRWAL